MAAAFVPNRRRIRFELTLRIIDLNNVPLVSGTSLVKWHLPSSTAAEHRGRTNKLGIHDHRVEYEYEKKVIVRLTVGKDGMLQECNVAFEVLQEYSAAGRGERIRLGEVKLNLAEYVEASENPAPASPSAHTTSGDATEGVVRRYLMQESKINSTLKIGIYMRHLEGTRDYMAPPLRTAPVFGGIAGIISHSETPAVAQSTFGHDGDSATSVRDVAPMSLTHANRELGESQDMYRRTLAAYLFSAPGELKADEAIEDIFAGGDGWGRAWRPPGSVRADHFSQDASHSGTSTPTISQDSDVNSGKAYGSMPQRSRGFGAAMNKRTKHGHKHRHPHKGKGEIDEAEVRDDFRTWTVGTAAMS